MIRFTSAVTSRPAAILPPKQMISLPERKVTRTAKKTATWSRLQTWLWVM
jgi:hypothetical protein